MSKAKATRLSNRAVKMKGRRAKTWAKGHSSDSNPSFTKFRDIAAKSRFMINETTVQQSQRTSKPKKKIRFDDTLNTLDKSEKLLENLSLDDKQKEEDDKFTFSQWCKDAGIYNCLAEKDIEKMSLILPRFFEILINQLCKTDQKATIFGSVSMIKQIIQGRINELFSLQPVDKNFCGNIVRLLGNLLNLKYITVWPQCFDILSTFFEICTNFDENCLSDLLNLKELLKSLAELRESDNFSYLPQLDKCIGSAIRHLGPGFVLKCIPLDIDPAKIGILAGNFSNSWLLPLLRSNIQKTKLAHFNKEFLPRAIAIKKKLESDISSLAERKILEVLQQQIWDLLPCYCNKPSDLAFSFLEIGPFLAKFLLSCPMLRLTILAGLRTLILRSDQTENKLEMAKHADKFLPIIINLFISNDTKTQEFLGYDLKGVRLACLETIRIYLTVAPTKLLNDYLNTAIKVFTSDKLTTDQKHRALDVLIALAQHLNCQDLIILFDFIKNFCDEKSCKDKSLQKKAYRILEEAFKSESEQTKQFFEQKRDEILSMMTSQLITASASTKASKLRCLTRLFENHLLETKLITEMLSDAVMCLKENNVKTRRSAAIFLITTSNLIIADEKDAQIGTKIIWNRLSHYFESENSTEVSCCLIAARLFIFEFKSDCSSEILSHFMSQVISLITKADRQIVQCCLEFFKTFVSCLPQITIGQYLELFVPALYTQTEDCQHHFRFLTRKILAKLLRKVPYELVCKHVPEGPFQKQLNNVRKALQRYEKRKVLGRKNIGGQDAFMEDDAISGVTGLSRPETIAQLLKDTDDEDDDDHDESNFDNRSKKSMASRFSAKTPKIFLHENDDDILDFTDARSVSKISTGQRLKMAQKENANANRSGKKDLGFKTDEQGRIIIMDDEDEIEDKDDFIDLGKRKTTTDNDDDDNELQTKKRKKSSNLVNEDSDIDEALHYRTGGKGIHRDLTKDDESKDFGAEKFRAKKAKGDMHAKGGTQPYAYVPFDFKQLNRRKRAKTTGRFKNLVEGARKGATKGTKGKRKSKK